MESVRWEDHESDLIKSVAKLYKNVELIDCVLETDGGLVKGHRAILAASSPFLKGLFQDYQDLITVPLMEVKYKEMKHILDFIYYGEVDVPITELDSFMRTAKFLQVLSLKNCVSPNFSKKCCNNNSCESSASNSGTVGSEDVDLSVQGNLLLCKKENHLSSYSEMLDSETVCDAPEKAADILESSSVKMSGIETEVSVPCEGVAEKNLIDDFTPISLGPVPPVFVNVENLDDRGDTRSESSCLNPLEEYALNCDVTNNSIVKVEELSEDSDTEEMAAVPRQSKACKRSWELLTGNEERGSKCENPDDVLHRLPSGHQRSNPHKRTAVAAEFQENADIKRISGTNIITSPNSSCAAAKSNAEGSLHEDWALGGSDCESTKRETFNLKSQLRQRDNDLAQMMKASFLQMRELVEVVHKDLKENLSKLDQKIDLVNQDLGGKVSTVTQLISQIRRSSISVPTSYSSDSLGEMVDIGQGITCSKLLYDMMWVCTEKADWAKTLLRGVFGPVAARMRVAPRKEGNKSFSKDFLLVAKALFRTWYMKIHSKEEGEGAAADVEVQVDSLPAYLSDRAAEMDGPRGLQRKLKAASSASPAEREAIRTLHRESLARRKEKESRRKRQERRQDNNSTEEEMAAAAAVLHRDGQLLAADQLAAFLESDPVFQH